MWCRRSLTLSLFILIAGTAQTAPIATVSVTANKGASIPQSFLGFSWEYTSIYNYTGTVESPNLAFAQMLSNLAQFNGPPLIRIGGNSEDESIWNPTGATEAWPNIHNITPAIFSGLSAAAATAGSQVILGLNLGSNNSDEAASLIDAAYDYFDPEQILGFEAGNEPDGFTGHLVQNGAQKQALRAQPWTYQNYIQQFEPFSDAIIPLLEGPALLVGPAFSGSWITQNHGPDFIAQENRRIGLVTLHYYPLTSCNKTSSDPKWPTISELLADTSAHNVATRFQSTIQAAKTYQLPVRMGEGNSVSCGGADGVSNTFASALWGADLLFELANAGAAGANFHTAGFYAAFAIANGALTVNPLYYGMLLFAEAVQGADAHSQPTLLQTQISTAANIKAWAAQDGAGATRIVLLNKDAAASGDVAVSVAAKSSASLVRLTSPSISAKQGITFGGQTFDQSTDGNPLGKIQSEKIDPQNGIYTVALPAYSAALLNIPRD